EHPGFEPRSGDRYLAPGDAHALDLGGRVGGPARVAAATGRGGSPAAATRRAGPLRGRLGPGSVPASRSQESLGGRRSGSGLERAAACVDRGPGAGLATPPSPSWWTGPRARQPNLGADDRLRETLEGPQDAGAGAETDGAALDRGCYSDQR